MIFHDRIEAGKKIADALRDYHGAQGVVLGLPRGGVICAAQVASALQIPLDVLFVRSITHPHSTEYAVGAVGENGTVILGGEAASVDQNWLEEEIDRQKKELLRERHLFMVNRPSVPLKNKVVIIVDDGLASGLAMEAAIDSVRRHSPERIVVAVPVAHNDAIAHIKGKVHDLVTIHKTDGPFYTASQFFSFFPQVSDHEVMQKLQLQV